MPGRFALIIGPVNMIEVSGIAFYFIIARWRIKKNTLGGLKNKIKTVD